MPADQPVAKFVASSDAQLAAVARKDGFRLGRIAGAEDVEDRERAAYERGLTEGRRQADSAINWGTSCVGCSDQLTGLYGERTRGYEEGLAEGRRLAAAEAKRDAERAQETADNRANAAWGEGYAEGRRELTAAADEAYHRALALGRRQATEGWQRELATPDCVVPSLAELLDTDEEIEADAVRTARLAPIVPLLHTHESGGPYRDCPECIAKAGHIRANEGHDRG